MPTPSTIWTPDAVRAAEERLRADRSNANELLDLLGLCESAADRTRLAAVQSCRAVFAEWAANRTLVFGLAAPDEGEQGVEAPLQVFRRWVLEQYRRFVVLLRRLVQRNDTPAGLRTPALDSMLQMAALEARFSKPAADDDDDAGGGAAARSHAFEAPAGAFAQMVGGLAACARAPTELLERLREPHLEQLDVSFFLLRAIQRLARPRQQAAAAQAAAAAGTARRGARPERLLDLLLLVVPPKRDSKPDEAALLARPAGKPAGWGAAAAHLLSAKKHRFEFGRAWRALLSLPALSDAVFHRAMEALPDACLAHVSRPLQFCDLLSDGYARGGVDALLALRGLFVLMVRHNLEYPLFYARLYNLLTPEALGGAHRAQFALELQKFLGSSGLPVTMIAAFAKRLCRIALVGTAPAAALAVALTFNVLHRHPTARVIAHRPRAGEPGAPSPAAADAATDAAANGGVGGGDGEAATLDREPGAAPLETFDADADDPEKSGAISSCLWEVDSLRAHHCPTVASLAALFAQPFTRETQPVPLEPLLAMSYRSLARLETRRKLRSVPLVPTQPAALFGGGGADGAGLASWR